MKSTQFFLALCTLLVSAALGADSEKPPQNIIEHYQWCSPAKSPAEVLSRYEGLWAHYRPSEVGYEDAIHVHFVHLCAYRLAEIYADAGKVDKCLDILKWLEKEDYFIK